MTSVVSSTLIPPATCRSCGSVDVRPSRQKERGDSERSARGEQPYRCRGCGSRFYVFAPAVVEPGSRSRSSTRRLRDLWKHKRGTVLQAALFILMLVLFLFCLRYLSHYQPDSTPSSYLRKPVPALA